MSLFNFSAIPGSLTAAKWAPSRVGTTWRGRQGSLWSFGRRRRNSSYQESIFSQLASVARCCDGSVFPSELFVDW